MAGAVPIAFFVPSLPFSLRLLAAGALAVAVFRLLRTPLSAWTRIAAAAALSAYAMIPILGALLAGTAGLTLWLRRCPPASLAPRRWILAGLVFGITSGWIVVFTGVDQPTGGFRAHLYPYAWERPLLSQRPLAVVVVVLASAFNAVGEEWLFRRLLLQQLKVEGLPTVLAIALSSLSFGVAHIRSGLPGGLLGFLLTAAFGAVMGIAYVAQPDARPFIVSAHFAADLLVIGRALVL